MTSEMAPQADGPIVELVVFKLVAGATAQQLTDAAIGVSDWVSRQPGFVSRELSYSQESNQWVDLVRWENMGSATIASEAAMSSEQCAPMFSLIDMEQTMMLHADPVIDPVLPRLS